MDEEDTNLWAEYEKDFRENGLPKIQGSATSMLLYSGDGTDFDVKQATELGAMLLLDKPIILIALPGAKIPTRLRRAADRVLEDYHLEDPDSWHLLREALDSLQDTLPERMNE